MLRYQTPFVYVESVSAQCAPARAYSFEKISLPRIFIRDFPNFPQICQEKCAEIIWAQKKEEWSDKCPFIVFIETNEFHRIAS